MYISQAEMPALELKGKPLMVDSEQMENGRLEIVDVNGILYHIVAEIVRFAVGNPRL